jgi:hypothetical protein
MASAAVQVSNFVGKEVNGFEIIKLIDTLIDYLYKYTLMYALIGQGKFSYVFKA